MRKASPELVGYHDSDREVIVTVNATRPDTFLQVSFSVLDTKLLAVKLSFIEEIYFISNQFRAAMVVALMAPQLYFYPQVAKAVERPVSKRVVSAIQVSLKLPTKWEKQPHIKKLTKQRIQARRKAEAVKRVLHSPRYSRPFRQPLRAPAAPLLRAVGGLTGSVGYTIPWGNCVNQVPVGRRPGGNPISWPVTTQTPYIGAIALWHYNHVGIVTGLWSDGSLEIRHENGGGLGHRFPRSEFRGFR